MSTPSSPHLPDGITDAMRLPLMVLVAAFLVMYLPVYYALANGAWDSDANGHGPMILGVVSWILWTDRHEIFRAATQPRPVWGFAFLLMGLLGYVVGSSQSVDTISAASQIPVLMAGLLMVGGFGALRRAWFPLFFLLFMIPLPGVLTQMLTLPLKAAVSYVSEVILYAAGYPIGRTGVTLVVGPYQLLVADACSGLNSIFTLEALGLFYMKLMAYKSKTRNILLAVMIVPISFISNVVRVLALILITYYYGDEAGQGFMHNFAGMILFAVALVLTYGFDRLIAKRFDEEEARLRKAAATS